LFLSTSKGEKECFGGKLPRAIGGIVQTKQSKSSSVELAGVGLLHTIPAKSNDKRLFSMGIVASAIRFAQFVGRLLFSAAHAAHRNRFSDWK
jgi:hypothetical protein